MPLEPLVPPRTLNPAGEPRRVGVEIEFSGLNCRQAAAVVQALFGGRLEEEDPHRARVVGSRLGNFVIELDMSAAHPRSHPGGGLTSLVEGKARSALGKVGSLIMPHEVASPPIPIAELAEADRLAEALREAGAKGTGGNPLHAFGLHLNPEVASCSAGYLVEHLRAFVLLVPWLRREIGIDLTRRISPFIEPWPADYLLRLADPTYRPDLPRLMDDYLDANRSRNRELDMLPLFSLLDGERVARRVRDHHVRPRPTFHYRLPNSRLDEPGWGVVADWNRWVQVERLAADAPRLDGMARDYLEWASGRLPWGWSDVARRWIA